MRLDQFSRREEAKVSLIEGDVDTTLPGKSARKTFGLEIPDIETEIESCNFWLRRDGSGLKFTKYDEQVLRVAARGESVTLGRDEAAPGRRSLAAPRAPVEPLSLVSGRFQKKGDSDATGRELKRLVQKGAGFSQQRSSRR